MNIWVIIYIAWVAFGLGLVVHRWIVGNRVITLSIFDVLVGPAISIFLLYKTGFFSLI